jgi:hypothetical protein
MNQNVPKKERFFKQVKLTSTDEVYVGIDVHKINCHIAIRLNGVIALTYVTPSDNPGIVRQMQQLQPAVRKIVYETGPTGFSLVRTLRAASLPAAVIAPSKTLRLSVRSSKDCARSITLSSGVKSEMPNTEMQINHPPDPIAQSPLYFSKSKKHCPILYIFPPDYTTLTILQKTKLFCRNFHRSRPTSMT